MREKNRRSETDSYVTESAAADNVQSWDMGIGSIVISGTRLRVMREIEILERDVVPLSIAQIIVLEQTADECSSLSAIDINGVPASAAATRIRLRDTSV